jgi:hypothetical protein
MLVSGFMFVGMSFSWYGMKKEALLKRLRDKKQ